MTVPDDPPESGSYLLRMWKEQGAPSSWRFSLENVQDGQRRGFGSLGSLVTFLEQEVEQAERHRSARRS